MRSTARHALALGALLLAAALALQLWYLGCILVWRWADPGSSAYMRRELARLQSVDRKAQLRHRWVPYERISAPLKRAVITAEDARFAGHEGIDWDALRKAHETNRQRGRAARGGSTITQQLAKNLFLSFERSYWRKGQELVIALMIEAVWDKRRILEVYLNVVEWGDGLFGAEAAARHYYGTSAAALGNEQAARLAAYLPSPKRYGRLRGGAYLDERTQAILRFMPDAEVP